MAFKVKFVDPGKNYRSIKDEIDKVFFDIMERGALINRAELNTFEANLASFVGTKYAVGLNSGYHALFISCLAAGIGPGDEVLVPSHTFVATASAVVNAGGTPVLVDVGKDFNIDVTKIEAAITSKTRAIIPVHLNGRIADMDAIMAIAEKHRLQVIEDACQSLGATFRGKGAGSFGLTGCWSFYPFKILGCYGDGGAITTNDAKVAEMAIRYRYNGEDRGSGEYFYHGQTCLLDNLQAAFLDVKLRKLPNWIKRRQEIAALYYKRLKDIPEILLPHYNEAHSTHVYQNYVIRLPRKRDEVFQFLKDKGIETLIHWRIPYYRHENLHFTQKDFPETEAISAESISLPMNVELSDDDVRYVIETLTSFFKKA